MDRKLKGERNAGLDIIRLLCAFFVICIHCSFAGRDRIEPVTRAAVPVFFMISGWFYSEDREKQKRQLLKVLRILLLSCGLYLLWEAAMTCLEGGALRETAASWFTVKNLGRFVLFGETPFGRHLWYLQALLYVLMTGAVSGERGRRRLSLLILPLLAGALILGAYSPLLLGRKLSAVYGRNFLFTGLPCFLLGGLIRREEKLRLKLPAAWLLLILSVLLSQWEKAFLFARTGYDGADLYVTSLLTAYALFNIGILSGQGESPAVKLLSRWGRELTLGIYILHPILLDLVQLVFGGLFSRSYAAASFYYHTAPLLVLLLSMGLTALLKGAEKKLLHR